MNSAVAESPDVVTVTVTVPLACAGVRTLSVVEDVVTATLVEGAVPKETAVVVVNPVPVMVTVVPPVTVPDEGVMPVTVGAVEDDGDGWDVT